MGRSPESQFQLAAKRTVERARKAQKRTTKQLTKQSDDFLGKNAPQNYAQAVIDIGKASGSGFPKYVRTVEDRFFNTAQELTEQGRRDLRNFEPGLIGSQSTADTTAYLEAVGKQFADKVREEGEYGRNRLFALPEQAQRAFSASALNPAFENLANVQYMNLAQDPPTIQNDARKMFRDLYTYNV